jgi:ABC-type multidrug transport system ATPase subunit
MKISIEARNINKRYINQQVIKDFSYLFSFPNAYAIIGANGSGKSTLLQILSGFLVQTNGEISYSINNANIEENEIFKHISICAPYQELIEEFSLSEYIEFHFKFKTKIDVSLFNEMLEDSGLNKSLNKQLKYFSSGMKQRVKLLLALGSNTPILLLDEPTSNLDKQGVDWYLKYVQISKESRLIIIASNDTIEYSFCEHTVSQN